MDEAFGVDITTSSLGYFYFDSTDQNYTYDDLNGNTTISARAINKAVSKGVICFSAAGNSGPSPMTMVTPADADSCVAVAAVMLTGKRLQVLHHTDQEAMASGSPILPQKA